MDSDNFDVESNKYYMLCLSLCNISYPACKA